MKNERKIFLISIFVIFLSLVAILFLPFIASLVLGMMFAVVFNPLYDKLAYVIKNNTLRASLLTLLVVLVILTPTTLIIKGAINEALTISSNIGDFNSAQGIKLLNSGKNLFNDFENNLSRKFNINLEKELESGAKQILGGLSNFIYTNFSKFVTSGPKLIMGFFIFIITIFYYLRDGLKLRDFFLRISPLSNEDDLVLLGRAKEVGRAILYGNIISALSQGVLGGFGFWIFGIGSPILWGTLMALLALIPVLGPFVIFIPAGIYLLLSGNVLLAILFFAYNFILVNGIDNIVKPILIGDKTKVHPFLVLLSIIGGLFTFGLIGIVYGPLILVIFITLTSLYLKNNVKI